MKTPKIEYEVFYPLNGKKLEKLDLNKCKDMKVDISIPYRIEDKDLDKYNSSSNFYNDICYKYESDKGIDVSLNDRKNEYINNDMNVCEEKCDFIDYDKNNLKAKCSCEIKNTMTSFSEIINNRTLLLNNFKDIKNLVNLKIMKCYKNLFSKNGITNNIGAYIIISILIFHFISILIFYKKEFSIIKNKIFNIVKDITNRNKNKNINKKEKEKENISAPIKKKKVKRKRKVNNYSINAIQTNSTNIIQKANNKLNENSKIKININNNLNYTTKSESIIKLNIYEMNNLTYKEALKIDKRNYIQYYLSLLKTKQLIFFSFFPLNDYNSRIIKIDLFFISFSIYFTINALFFNDSTMHKIYIDDGAYNLSYQIVQIVYSSLISSILNLILKVLALSEKNILEIKQSLKEKINEKAKNIINFLFYKFILFFIISSSFLILFWYYISCFCAIYGNTQIHLIKDTVISFGLSMIYPFAIFLLPGIFRIASLKSSGRENIYKLSKIIQLI